MPTPTISGLLGEDTLQRLCGTVPRKDKEALPTSHWLSSHSDITPWDLYVLLSVRWGGDSHFTGGGES